MEPKCHTRRLVNGETFFVCGNVGCVHEEKLPKEYELPEPKPYSILIAKVGIVTCPVCNVRRILL